MVWGLVACVYRLCSSSSSTVGLLFSWCSAQHPSPDVQDSGRIRKREKQESLWTKLQCILRMTHPLKLVSAYVWMQCYKMLSIWLEGIQMHPNSMETCLTGQRRRARQCELKRQEDSKIHGLASTKPAVLQTNRHTQTEAIRHDCTNVKYHCVLAVYIIYTTTIQNILPCMQGMEFSTALLVIISLLLRF